MLTAIKLNSQLRSERYEVYDVFLNRLLALELHSSNLTVS